MTTTLPGWVVDDFTAVQREAARYREMPPDERARWVLVACRDAVRLTVSRPDARRILDHRDALSDESIALLERLRRGPRRKTLR